MRAGGLLQQKLDDISLSGATVQAGAGWFKAPDEDFQWRVEIPVTSGDDEARLDTLAVTVWQEGRAEHVLHARLRTGMTE